MRRLTFEERFWSWVKKHDGDDACWTWFGAMFRNKKVYYGHLNVSSITGKVNQTKLAHVVSWFLAHGVWPKKNICHSCDNPLCVRPKHLWEGTVKQNNKDMCNKGRNFDIGERSRKLSLQDVQFARDNQIKMTQQQIADRLGVTRSTISSLQLGHTHNDR